MLTTKRLNRMTKAYSFTKRLLAGAVVLLGVFTASNAGAETPPTTEWTYDASAKTISSPSACRV